MNPLSIIQHTSTKRILSTAPALLQQQEEGVQDLAEPPLRGLPVSVSRIAQAVLERHPVLLNMIRRHGKKSIGSYLSEYVTFVRKPEHTDRHTQCIEAIARESERVYGPRIATSVAAQLRHYFFASTTDHHGPLHHPWVMNFNLMTGAAALRHPDSALCNVITLACTNVSLNNFSFPRGISFTPDGPNAMGQRRMSFFSNRFVGTRSVVGQPAYNRSCVDRMMAGLQELRSSCSVTRDTACSLHRIFNTLYAHPDVLSCTTYADQVSRLNFLLWERLNIRSAQKNVRFIYLGQEAIARHLIIAHHLTHDTFLHRIIFDTSSQPILKKHFDGLRTCFSEKDCEGTYLFWALVPGTGMRVQLWKKGGDLVSPDGSYRISLTPEAIGSALKRGELIPSVLTTFLVLCFYYGLTCLGGLGQVAYLAAMKEAYQDMAQSLGDTESLNVCRNIETDHLGGEMMIALLSQSPSKVCPATALDLVLYGDSSTIHRVASLAREISFADAMMVTMPTEYPMRYSPHERDASIAAITMDDMALEMSKANRISPVLSLGRS